MELKDRIASLSEEKRALLEHLLAKKEAEDAGRRGIPRRQGGNPPPLSFSQQRLWFLDQFEPGSPLYNNPCRLLLAGVLDIRSLARALDEIVCRHEALRTTFTVVGESPVQVIHDPVALPLPIVDLSCLPEEGRTAESRRLIEEEALRPFDLGQGPLFRASLLRLGDEEHILLLTMHHIVSDGWSLGVLMAELKALYNAYHKDLPCPLPPLAIQYADYACWQREWLQGDELQRQLGYWKGQLSGAPALLELPTDRPRPAVQSFRGAELRFELSSEITQGLKALSQQEGSTLFMMLLAAFQILISRHSGQQDVVVGTPIANRTRSEVEGLIGFFVNTLAIRSDVSGDLSFRAFLAQVREGALGAYAHQDLPFEKLVEELQPGRSLSHSPLFQVMFTLQSAARSSLELEGLHVTGLGGQRVTAKFDLSLGLSETAGGLRGSLEYNTDLFDAERIERMASHFQTLLEGVVADPEQRLARLPLLTPAERHQVLEQWNDTAVAYPQERCLHQLFEEQVDLTPDALAVRSETATLSYRELEERANSLAHHLRSLGVRPGICVGVAVERSAELVVALLGILKAGGAYVPVDPDYPPARVSYMLENSAVPVLLVQSAAIARLPAQTASLLCVDRDWNRIALQPTTRPSQEVNAQDPAYVIYTSGSSGRPKGVIIPHRAIVNHMAWMTQTYRFTCQDRILQKTPISFDASVWEFWAPLMSGAELVMARPDGHREPDYLAEVIRQANITTLQTVPSLLQVLLEEPSLGQCQSLRRVFCGGEALTTELQRHFFARFGDRVELHNLYGPTEAAIDATTFACLPGWKRATVPIGRPIANLEAYILDTVGNPLPVGVPGELYLGGAGLAHGYLKRPELTAEKFVPDPFGRTPGARLYRTGDRAQRLADGNIEYLGRVDHQVKVRGFRIELGEIESVLVRHPWVREAVVVAREDSPGDKRLVAYVVSLAAALSGSPLREHLRQQLPEYMVPSAFVFLEALPLSPNGKVDRKALLAPEATVDAAAYVAPRTPIEDSLAEIWREVLRVDRVGVHDSFFELGGHSLLATQVISRIRTTFQVDLPLRALFETPSVADLAQRIASREGLTSEMPRLTPVSRQTHLPLSFAQQRLWFLDQLDPGNSVYNIPIRLRLSGPLNQNALARTLTEIVRRHEALRTTVTTADGEPVQVIHSPQDVPLPLTDLSHGSEQEQRRLLRERGKAEAQASFDLEQGPLFRAGLLRLGDQDHLLLLTLHHIVSDGWSLGVLMRELGTLYPAFCDDRPSPLPELALQYADYAVWQRAWLQGEALERQLGYWKAQLGGAPALLELPTDRPRPAMQSFRGASQGLELSAELTQALKGLSQQEGATLFMTLLAAFQTLLMRYSGQDDIVVGTPIANRTQAEVEGLIGLFMNTLALRGDLSGDPGFTELLSRVRDSALGAYAHQDLPFEKLVEELRPERSLSHSPVFQVMLMLQNAPRTRLEFEGLRIQSLGSSEVTAKFDLSLSLAESGDKLRGALEYNTDLFEAERIEELLSHFRTLLEGIVADPQQRLSRLPLLTPSERHQVLEQWNDTAAEYPRERCLHELFEEQVERTPEAVAVVFEDQRLTYRELNARANQLARSLVAEGVGPETLVGVCLERSLEMLIGLLGILKAGGAYVPLDPTWPQERLESIVANTQLGLVLTHTQLLEALPHNLHRRVCLDAQQQALGRESTLPVTSRVRAANLAYVLHTSGSTGRPKGVPIPHQALVNFLCSMTKTPGICAADVLVAVTTLSFDIAALELWLPLLVGARVVVASRDEVMDAPRLAGLLERSKATVMQATPATWRMLLDGGWRGGSGLKTLCGGEALSRELARDLRDQDCVLWNLYGPTETTIWSSVEAVREVEGSISIGRPIANTRLYVLDRTLQPVPVGVSGDLYIGGDGLARGYLNRPELTAETFVADPFSSESGSRMYRTGDQARYLADGRLECLGRVDHQVKVRGFRIELGEIESVLASHPQVREAVVVAREDSPGDRRLVAYVVGADAALSGSQLREHLKAKLPEYMVPSAFVFLEALPLSSNGKVDRRALPAPEATLDAAAYVAPRTPIEDSLAEIWREVLRVDRVGVHDSFFELGGHSLLATQVISRIRTTFQVDVSLRALFEFPTIAELAQQVEQSCREGQGLLLPPLLPVSRDTPLPLSFSQQRLWFIDHLQSGSTVYNVSSNLRLHGHLDVSALHRALQEIVRRHEVLRTTFCTRGADLVQVISAHTDLPLTMTDLSALPVAERDEQTRLHCRAEDARPFDLSQDKMLRAQLLKLSAEEHVLLLTVHHIASDAWSQGVLMQELNALYNAFHTDKPSPLQDLSIQYADYAVWQRQWLQAEALDQQISYWTKRLAGAPTLLELPADRPRPPMPTLRGARKRIEISTEVTRALKALGQKENTTLYMTLLAAFQTLLFRFSGQDDIVVGTPIANRTRPELERLVGFFVNTLVLRGDLSGDPSFRELLSRVRETALEAYAHQDLPFEKLVEALQPERSLSHSPLFQVLFGFQNAPGAAFELEGLQVQPVGSEGVPAKFDLHMIAWEGQNGLVFSLEYNTDLFNDDRMQRLMQHLRTLLEGIVVDPNERISRLPLLSESERSQLLTEWNATAAAYPRDRCVHQLFEQQVQRTPEATAVVSEDQRLTYQQLNARANQLAHYLRHLGVGPETRVGLCLERSLEMVVGLLGILKAGGAYVPLDPSSPLDRLAFMIADAQVPVLLTRQDRVDELPNSWAQLLCLDSDWERIASHSQTNPVNTATAANLAYVIYTSGTTGTPKGAMIVHQGLTNYLAWCQTAYAPDSATGSPVHSSLAFDLTVTSLFPALLCGRAVHLLSETAGVEALASALEPAPDWSLVKITPAHLDLLSRQVAAEQASLGTRAFVIGGEALLGEQLEFWRLHAPGTRLINEYGPTETVVGCCVYECPPQTPAVGSVPIGRPIANTRLYVLDRRLQPVPVGVLGELYIGGDGLGRGYLGRPELTAATFVADPFSSEAGARLYRTGDVCRYLSDGNLEYVGRVDHQVKVRGFRIELGEIESVLLEHAGVLEAVVLAREDVAGDKRLVGYVVSADAALGVSQLREHLKAKLPEYMIPSAFVFLEALPLTVNGKVDRRALPAPEASGREEAYVAPRTAVESVLAELWGELLGRGEVSVLDSFFELGGHSLLATQVISQVQETFQVDVPLRALFDAPTIASFADLMLLDPATRPQIESMAEALVSLSGLSDEELEERLKQVEANGDETWK